MTRRTAVSIFAIFLRSTVNKGRMLSLMREAA